MAWHQESKRKKNSNTIQRSIKKQKQRNKPKHPYTVSSYLAVVFKEKDKNQTGTRYCIIKTLIGKYS